MLAIVVCEFECIEYLLSKCSYKKVYDLKNIQIYQVNYCDIDFLILVSGYGKMNISSALTNLVNKYKVSEIISLGTTSSTCYNIDLLDAIIAKNAIQFDVDFSPIGLDFFCLPNEKENIYQTDNMLNYLLKMACIHCDNKYHQVFVGSGDSFVNNYNKIRYLKNNLNIKAVDNETGSVGQFCSLYDIPFSSLKIVSNYANDCAKEQYTFYKKEANIIGNRLILNFIKEFYHK